MVGPGAAAVERGGAGGERLIYELWADEVHVRVERAGREDHSFAGERLGCYPDDLRVARSHTVGLWG